MHKYALVAAARWEEQNIAEWIEYHRSIGFDHFYIYGHDNEPMTLYHALFPYLFGPKPVVTYRYWPKPGQFAAMYVDFLRNHAHETEWFGIFDVGEYLTLRHVHDVDEFLAPFKRDWDAVAFHTFNFAPGPDVPGSVLLARIWRGAKLDVRCKVLTRSSAVDHSVLPQGLTQGVRPFWWGWDGYDLPHMRECDVLGVSMQGTATDFPSVARAHIAAPGVEEAIVEKAVIARIAFNTVEELKRRIEYGGLIDQGYWQHVVTQGQLDDVVRSLATVIDTTLADYWRAKVLPTLDFYAEPARADAAVNVALGKISWQSSILKLPPGETLNGQAAGGANNGRKTGSFGFHTELQANPWWVVDLKTPYRIGGVRIYNRCDTPTMAARARRLRIEISLDSVNWKVLFASENGIDFGGIADQLPLELKTPPTSVARYCKLSLDETNYFHLDEVEIYGVPA